MSPPPSSTFRTPRVRKPTNPPNPISTHAPLFLSDHTLYGSARLGQRQQNKIVNQNYVPPGTHNLVGVTYVQRGWKAYELSNHLGNVLSVISDRKEAGHCNDTLVAFYYPDIIQNNDYYPFGSPMEGRVQQSKAYRFGFNGKEKDQEGMGGGSSTYDYGFRIYNPALGKFLSVDPLTKDYPWYTPYQFAGNKPIWTIDLDGLEEFIVTDFYFNGRYYGTEITIVSGAGAGVEMFGSNFTLHYNQVTTFSISGTSTTKVKYLGTLFGRGNLRPPTISELGIDRGSDAQAPGIDENFFKEYVYGGLQNTSNINPEYQIAYKATSLEERRSGGRKYIRGIYLGNINSASSATEVDYYFIRRDERAQKSIRIFLPNPEIDFEQVPAIFPNENGISNATGPNILLTQDGPIQTEQANGSRTSHYYRNNPSPSSKVNIPSQGELDRNGGRSNGNLTNETFSYS